MQVAYPQLIQTHGRFHKNFLWFQDHNCSLSITRWKNENHVPLCAQILIFVCAYFFTVVRTISIIRTKTYKNMRTSTCFVHRCTVQRNGCTYKIFPADCPLPYRFILQFHRMIGSSKHDVCGSDTK